MKTIETSMNPISRQRGAALVVGLLLLLVITLLAIAGMNSSTLEYVMAGNAQYHQRAFQAAETGIQQAIAYANLVPTNAAALPGVTVSVPNTASDTFTVQYTSDLNGAQVNMIWGNSINQFTGYDFTVVSTGNSARGATSTHTQGIFQLAPGTPPN